MVHQPHPHPHQRMCQLDINHRENWAATLTFNHLSYGRKAKIEYSQILFSQDFFTNCWLDMYVAINCLNGTVLCRTVYYKLQSHLPWRPFNLNVSDQRQFHLPPALFTCLMKNWGPCKLSPGNFCTFAKISGEFAKELKMTFLGLKTIYIFIIHTKE